LTIAALGLGMLLGFALIAVVRAVMHRLTCDCYRWRRRPETIDSAGLVRSLRDGIVVEDYESLIIEVEEGAN